MFHIEAENWAHKFRVSLSVSNTVVTTASNARVNICRGVFQPVSDPCEELNAHWRTLGTSLFPAGAMIPAVTQSTTPAEIKHFISNLPTPAGTKAVGVFSGACGLADNPHKNLALVVNYCGVSKASQPTVAADADPAPRTAAAAAAPEVDFSAAFNAALGF